MLYPSTGVAHARPEIRLIDTTGLDSGAIEIRADVIQNPRILSLQSRSPTSPTRSCDFGSAWAPAGSVGKEGRTREDARKDSRPFG